MEPLSILAIGSALAGAIATGYNAYNTSRENEIMREREDTAISRRMRDLEASGLSPTLAAGSAATAQGGNAPSIDMNGVNDAIFAREKVRQVKAATRAAEAEAQQAQNMAAMSSNARREDDLKTHWLLGYSPANYWFSMDPAYNNEIWFSNDASQAITKDGKTTHWTNPNIAASPLIRSLEMGLMNQGYQSDMLRKENNWYNFNQGLNVFNSGVNAFGTFSRFGLGLQGNNIKRGDIAFRNSPFESTSTYYGRDGKVHHQTYTKSSR